MSHDWPTNIVQYGNKRRLLAVKPYFRDEVERGELGSRPAEMLLRKLMPRYWFSAHLHVRFTAEVPHVKEEPLAATLEMDSPEMEGDIVMEEKGEPEFESEGEIMLEDEDQTEPIVESEGEIDLDADESVDTVKKKKMSKEEIKKAQRPNLSPAETEQRKVRKQQFPTTSFLALDKCLPRRSFIELLSIKRGKDVPFSNQLSYDPRWLAITKTFHQYLSTKTRQNQLPSEEELLAYLPRNDR
jgi:lariat debranching enzyme